MIYHFAGQAGVRYSIKQPNEYIKDNIIAYINLLENFKKSKKLKCIFMRVVHLFMGTMYIVRQSFLQKTYFCLCSLKTNYGITLNVYFNLYNLKCVGLRFCLWALGEPDMAYYKFCNLIYRNKKLKYLTKITQSFTYIDDIIENILLIQDLKKLISKK